MILLIIGVGMLNFLLSAHLNSIMFLLIHEIDPLVSFAYNIFKFHYVSINSCHSWIDVRFFKRL